MKGFILCAGLGTRLSSLNLNCPKVMVPIGGKPLLEHHLELFRSQGILEICLNLHAMPEMIKHYFQDGSRFGIHLTYSYEPELLGTAGAIGKMKNWIGNEPCLVFYGDNLTYVRFDPLIQFHKNRQSSITLFTYESKEPWTGGIVETDQDGKVKLLVEKPDREKCPTNCISSGIFILEPSILHLIPEQTFSDFGKDIFPKIISKNIPFYALKTNGYIQDIGTPERYAKVEKEFKEGKVKFYD